MDKLVGFQDDARLISIILSVSCLLVIAEANTNLEVSHVIDIVNEFRVSVKYLTIKIPELDLSILQNKTINFNVLIHRRPAGINICLKLSSRSPYLIYFTPMMNINGIKGTIYYNYIIIRSEITFSALEQVLGLMGNFLL